MFRGRYFHTIDPKGRVSIPAKFREALGSEYSGRLVVVPNDHCLEVHPLEEWQRIEAKVRELSIFNPEVKKISRLYISKAKDVDLDAQGRILIPPDSRAEAGLVKEAALVGGGLMHFEIWDRRRFEEFDRVHQDELPTVFE
ncbi:MAG: division/cell wall cluster transcriptional repressor MraZ, partial [Candidatus Rokubacteria bacterium]|nr:division/cell wall cluster transcriptional repressor MraZ [Candidatus Rokubacteria bacterium]